MRGLDLKLDDLYEDIEFSDLHDLTKLEVSDEWRTILRLVYQDTSTHTNLRSKITQAHQQLQKSGYCDPNSPRGIWQLTERGTRNG